MTKPESEHILEKVSDLINYLETLGRDRVLIYDSDGNTDIVTTNDILLWDPSNEDSPVALMDRLWEEKQYLQNF